MTKRRDIEITADTVRGLIERVMGYLDARTEVPGPLPWKEFQRHPDVMLRQARDVLECMALNAGLWGPARTDVALVPPDMEKPPKERRCPICGVGEALEAIRVQEFGYGPGGVMVFLSSDVPVWRCVCCGEFFSDWRGREPQPRAMSEYVRSRRLHAQGSTNETD